MDAFPQEQTISVVISTFILAFIVFIIALRAGYFKLPSSPFSFEIHFRQVLGAFLIYIVLALFLPVLALFLIKPLGLQIEEMKESWSKWGHIAFLFILFLFLAGYCLCLKRATIKPLLWGPEKPSLKRFSHTFIKGVLCWIVSYPIVLFVSSLTGMISLMVWGKSGVDQVAVEHLKNTMDSPILFAFMIFFVAVFVPFMEELLFRGFLQSYLRKYLGRMAGIIITALIFALVHYAKSQGIGNFQLIISLFVLALFLGFIYEKERALWAPFAMHLTFNLISALLIFFQTQFKIAFVG